MCEERRGWDDAAITEEKLVTPEERRKYPSSDVCWKPGSATILHTEATLSKT